jgi:hypothetical protein
MKNPYKLEKLQTISVIFGNYVVLFRLILIGNLREQKMQNKQRIALSKIQFTFFRLFA